MLALLALFATASFGTLAITASPAAAYPTATVTIIGHGWGNGDGMGQWGALGYAIGQDGGAGNFTYQEILAHYYGGTTLSTDADPTDSESIRVALLENSGNFLIATAPGGVTLPTGGTAGAVMFQPESPPSMWNVYASSNCAGGSSDPSTAWNNQTPVGQTTDPVTQAATSGQALELCGPNTQYQGELEAVENSAGEERTVNVLPLAQYLDGVVPSESPSSWGGLGSPGPQGQDWGFQELEAQAVAARSYVLASKAAGGYFGYADICDTTACQAYTGLAEQANPYTSQAVTDTAGQVMENGSGAIASTTYSASTGGYTSGPAFPPVDDAGDAVCVPGACNPNHSWSVQVPVSAVEAQWPTVGALQSIEVASRNGLGDLGGRAVTVVVAGTTGSVTVSGGTFAADLGLKSDWFAIVDQPSGGVGGYWFSAADGGIFSFGDAAFYGSMGGRPLNQPIVGMAATPDGGGYWEVAADGGIFAFGDAAFYGSAAGTSGGSGAVAIAATATGRGYLIVNGAGQISSFGDAPQLGDLTTAVPNYSGHVVALATTPG